MVHAWYLLTNRASKNKDIFSVVNAYASRQGLCKTITQQRHIQKILDLHGLALGSKMHAKA